MPNGLVLSQIKAVLFDVDGTLVDSLEMLVNGLGDAYEKYNGSRPSDDEIRALMGLPLRKQLQLFRATVPTEDELDEMMAYTMQRFDAHKHLERVFEPAVEALRMCRANGLKTALVTSKSSAELGPFLDRFSGAAYVTTAVCASDVINPKPHPECVQLACSRFGIEPEEAVMIGDSTYDIQAAKAAGVKAVAVTYGSVSDNELRKEEPDLLLSTPDDLLLWVSQSLLRAPCHERK